MTQTIDALWNGELPFVSTAAPMTRRPIVLCGSSRRGALSFGRS